MSTPNTIKAQLQNLIDIANRVTGKSDTDLTGAIDTLVNERETLINGSITEVYSEVTELGAMSLANNPNMTSVTLPNVTDVGYMGLAYNNSLKSVDMPNAKAFGSHVFYQCTELENIDLPSIRNVGANMFNGCSSLKFANIHLVDGSSGNTFANCVELKAVRIEKQTMIPTLTSANAFSNTPIESGTGFIYVARRLIDDYKTATNWVTYASQFRVLEDYTVDGTITGEFDWNKIDGGSV